MSEVKKMWVTLTGLCVYYVKKESETRMTATVLAFLNKIKG